MKQLMRWIVLSEAYGLSSQIGPRNKEDDPALGAAAVQPVLRAADGGRAVVRIAAGGDAGRRADEGV